MRRPIRHILLALSAALFVLFLLAWRFTWRSPAYYTAYGNVDLPAPVLTQEQYEAVHATFPRPYVVEVEYGGGGALLYGASHTKDPADPQIADIRRRWRTFRPTVALVEGRLGFLIDRVQDPVEAYGEAGEANALARRDGVPVYTWEPPRETEVALMLEKHPKERVALFYVLRPYFSNLRHGRPQDPDAWIEEFRASRTQLPGLEGTLPSVAAVDEMWRRDFARLPDWRDTSDAYGLPGYLADLARDSNAVRDEHFARVIVDLARKGERVFAVAGSSHAVKLEPALKGALASRGTSAAP